MKKLSLVFAILVLALSTALAQRTITGMVTDDEGEALIGANIRVDGTTVGTVTDLDGKYSINVPAGSETLIFSYTGYTTTEMTLGASNTIDVVLPLGVTLQEAVVTALGIKREEKALGFAVQEVDGDELVEANTTSVIDALNGKAAGVQITQSNGAAGASSRIVLRGQTSFNGNNQALIVVDGVRIDNQELSTERTLSGVAYSNRAMDINPNDIEDVTVLKGAAATALYGVEGARGVVLITTKKGKAGEGVKVNYTTNFGISQVTNLADKQMTYSQGDLGVYYGPDDPVGFSRALSWGPNINSLRYDGSEYEWDPRGRIVDQNDPNAGQAVVPFDAVDQFFQTGTTWRNNLSIMGGNDVINYRVSFGHSDENGVAPKNTFNRTNVGLAVGSSLLDGKLDINGSVNYVKSGGRRIQQGSNISGVMLGLLRTPITFDNTAGFSDPVNEPLSYQFANGAPRNYRGGIGYDNPFWVVNNTPFFDEVNRMFGNINAAYEFTPWVTLSTTLGTDFYTDNRLQEFEIGSNTARAGRVIEDNYNFRNIDAYVNILGNGSLNEDFTLGYNVGVNVYQTNLKQNYIQGDGLNFTGFRTISNTASTSSLIDHNEERTIGIFGTLDVGFRNFLYLTLTGRQDYISTLIDPAREFSAGDIDVFYPSASLSFVFSELVDVDWLSFGKARFSFAQVGGGAPGAYLTATTFTAPNTTGTINSLGDGWTEGILFPFQGTPGFTFNALAGNPNLIPSKTTDLEFGVDLRFLKNRLSFDGTFYTRESGDQIIAINIPNTTGFQRAVVNSGELRTVGGEIVLGITPIQKKDFNWTVSVNFSTWRTTVESLPDGVPNQYLDGFTGTGIYNIAPDEENDMTFEYGQLLGGAFQRVNAPNNTFDPDMPYNPDGALIIDDSGSSNPDSDDYNPNFGFPLADPNARVIGNPNPDWLMGINNSLSYKNFSFNFLFDIRQGGDIWNGTKGAMSFFGTSENTEDRVQTIDHPVRGPVHDYENANFTYEGVLASDGSANGIAVPLDELWYTGNGGGFGSVDEHYVEDGSFYRLRYATLSYNAGNLIKGIDNLTISFTGRNLLLITDYTGFDPDLSLVGSGSNGQGLDYFQLPNVRSYTFGLDFKF